MAEKHAATWHPGDGPTPRTVADVPSTGEVRRMYADRPGRFNTLAREFDAWLAEHDREVAAQALRDAARTWQTSDWANAPRRADRVAERLANGQYVTNWLRNRAAQTAPGKQP